MTRTTTSPLPLDTITAPTLESDVQRVVRDALATRTPIYPLGGQTSLDFGLPAKHRGIGLDLTGMSKVIDYPARDMTITVEAGLRWQTLVTTLAQENQRLPVDVPSAAEATVGGVLATNFNGPRRLGCGLLRDHVIGIAAVDGHGKLFHGGGRVVKNVAGYDFCKLLTGSLGTLAVITSATFKLQPIPECSKWVVCSPKTLEVADDLLAKMVHSKSRPLAVELLRGPAWAQDPALAPLAKSRGCETALAALLEGTNREVEWMTTQLQSEWRSAGIGDSIVIDDTAALVSRMVEFPAATSSPLVLKASLRPSVVTAIIASAEQVDPQVSVVSHAQSGILVLRFSEFPSSGISRAVVGRLQAEVAASVGSLVVLSNPSQSEMTQRSVFAIPQPVLAISTAIKREFDPGDLLNRGRFIFRSES
ncbi:FAD linked oxidase domain protein [Pirellula staleyi DSM 6068]|uniref:FAD linked oxidase domain protein n=1 Tax=Pirellula staleyi (strain ATCC 27377 / DSM 6068 / ICPB 4128) TaxID=530564 RepID=D2R6L7_PIRSD|nr:FAD-binding oxidoreductase [Pirellula staleyi]ADB17317.1 FAD linked oxidase domain protein [Pirellula staleyi DSM 6068]